MARAAATAAAAGFLLSAATVMAADRSHPPAPGPPRSVQLPHIERRALTNGLPLLVVEQHELPTVFAMLVVRSGAAADPADRPGLAAMTAGLLTEGAGGRDALTLADAEDVLGATIDADADWDHSLVTLHVPSARLADALPLMADVALRPTFLSAEVERSRQELLTLFLQFRDDPQTVAAAELDRALFGAHRYGGLVSGNARAVGQVEAADLRAFHDLHYRPGNAALLIVGDVTAKVAELAETAFGRWPRGAATDAPLPPPVHAPARTIWLVDRPQAAQSVIRVGRIGPDRATRRYHALAVMNAMLGGLFTSRLNTNLRETHQYAYSASSAFSFRRVAGRFVAQADVQTRSTADAVREIVTELEGIRGTAPADEVARARSFLAMSYAADFETPSDIASHLAELLIYGLPEDTFSRFVPAVLAVSPKDVERAARETIDPRDLAIVVVGDAQVVAGPLRALRLGEVRLLSADDVFGPAPYLAPSQSRRSDSSSASAGQ